MKKLILTLMISVIGLTLCNPAHANSRRAIQKKLTISGVDVTATNIANGNTVTTDGLFQTNNVGFSSMILLMSGDVAITYEVSKDNINWYPPYTTSGTTLTDASGIVSSVTANRWIVLPSKLAPYIRYKFTSTGASSITADTIWQDEY